MAHNVDRTEDAEPLPEAKCQPWENNLCDRRTIRVVAAFGLVSVLSWVLGLPDSDRHRTLESGCLQMKVLLSTEASVSQMGVLELREEQRLTFWLPIPFRKEVAAS